MLFTGALVAGATQSVMWGVFAAVANMVIVLVMADLTAPGIEEYLGMPGISLPHGFTQAFVPIAIVVNKLLDLIPGINKIEINADTLQKK
ncbi:PTS galactitol transporter subunit IIC, partial [Clostridioides difficile]